MMDSNIYFKKYLEDKLNKYSLKKEITYKIMLETSCNKYNKEPSYLKLISPSNGSCVIRSYVPVKYIEKSTSFDSISSLINCIYWKRLYKKNDCYICVINSDSTVIERIKLENE
jgi:hypothetical protein